MYAAKFSVVLQFINPLTPTVAMWVQLYKASCARPGEAVISNFWHPDTPTLRSER